MCGLEMPKKPVLDLVLKFRVGHEDVSVPVIGEDDALLLVSVVNDHLVVICLVLHKEKNLCLFKGSKDFFVFLVFGVGPVLLWQEHSNLNMNIEPSESKVSKCQDPSNLVAPLPKVLIGKAKTPN